MGSFVFFVIQLCTIQGKCRKLPSTDNIFQRSIDRRKAYFVSFSFDHIIDIIGSIVRLSDEFFNKIMILISRHDERNSR